MINAVEEVYQNHHFILSVIVIAIVETYLVKITKEDLRIASIIQEISYYCPL